ncbi:hypothetical protein KJ713_03320, partial [Patescibacteria group bacterium]|nr:hypothetical protein [Patescibacteria group bacterium]
MQKEATSEKKNNLLIIIIIAVVIIAVLAAIIIYLILKSNQAPTPSPSTSASVSETATASPEKRVGWETYNNSRFGYSIQVPPNLEKTESINGDGAAFTNWNPPMTITVWAKNNSLNMTAQQAIDADKEGLINDGMENFRVIVEGSIEMGGESAIESVWQYIAPPMGDAATSARAYVVKNNVIYSIEFLIDTNQWNSYSTMFDDIFTSFE